MYKRRLHTIILAISIGLFCYACDDDTNNANNINNTNNSNNTNNINNVNNSGNTNNINNTTCTETCEEWEECDANGNCVLLSGRCNGNDDCAVENEQCDTNTHFCVVLPECDTEDDCIDPALSVCSDDGECVADIPAFTNPIISNDDFFTGSKWNDPHVIYMDNQFIMYASADIDFAGNISVYRLISDDGVNWELSPETPVFEKNSDQTAFDKKSVETPSVVYYNGEYHLFYTGYPVDFADALSYRIGHATSPDGIVWTRDTGFELAPTDPHGTVNMDFNQFIVAEPGAVIVDNMLHLYFSAVGANAGVGSTLQTIGLTIYDGTDWSTPQMVVDPDLAVYPRDPYMGFSTPAALVINNEVHLYYDVVIETPWQQVAIHHAVSTDGISAWTQDSTSLLQFSDYVWTNEEMRAPSALYHNGSLYLYFAGHDDTSNLGIGLVVNP